MSSSGLDTVVFPFYGTTKGDGKLTIFPAKFSSMLEKMHLRKQKRVQLKTITFDVASMVMIQDKIEKPLKRLTSLPGMVCVDKAGQPTVSFDTKVGSQLLPMRDEDTIQTAKSILDVCPTLKCEVWFTPYYNPSLAGKEPKLIAGNLIARQEKAQTKPVTAVAAQADLKEEHVHGCGAILTTPDALNRQDDNSDEGSVSVASDIASESTKFSPLYMASPRITLPTLGSGLSPTPSPKPTASVIDWQTQSFVEVAQYKDMVFKGEVVYIEPVVDGRAMFGCRAEIAAIMMREQVSLLLHPACLSEPVSWNSIETGTEVEFTVAWNPLIRSAIEPGASVETIAFLYDYVALNVRVLDATESDRVSLIDDTKVDDFGDEDTVSLLDQVEWLNLVASPKLDRAMDAINSLTRFGEVMVTIDAASDRCGWVYDCVPNTMHELDPINSVVLKRNGDIVHQCTKGDRIMFSCDRDTSVVASYSATDFVELVENGDLFDATGKCNWNQTGVFVQDMLLNFQRSSDILFQMCKRSTTEAIVHQIVGSADMHMNGFLNSGRAGTLLFGITVDGHVKGVHGLTDARMNYITSQINARLSKFTPAIDASSYCVRFFPVSRAVRSAPGSIEGLYTVPYCFVVVIYISQNMADIGTIFRCAHGLAFERHGSMTQPISFTRQERRPLVASAEQVGPFLDFTGMFELPQDSLMKYIIWRLTNPPDKLHALSRPVVKASDVVICEVKPEQPTELEQMKYEVRDLKGMVADLIASSKEGHGVFKSVASASSSVSSKSGLERSVPLVAKVKAKTLKSDCMPVAMPIVGEQVSGFGFQKEYGDDGVLVIEAANVYKIVAMHITQARAWPQPSETHDRIFDKKTTLFLGQVEMGPVDKRVNGIGRAGKQKNAVYWAYKQALPKVITNIDTLNEILASEYQNYLASQAGARLPRSKKTLLSLKKPPGLGLLSQHKHPKCAIHEYCQSTQQKAPDVVIISTGCSKVPSWTAVVKFNGEEHVASSSKKKTAETAAFQELFDKLSAEW